MCFTLIAFYCIHSGNLYESDEPDPYDIPNESDESDESDNPDKSNKSDKSDDDSEYELNYKDDVRELDFYDNRHLKEDDGFLENFEDSGKKQK